MPLQASLKKLKYKSMYKIGIYQFFLNGSALYLKDFSFVKLNPYIGSIALKGSTGSF